MAGIQKICGVCGSDFEPRFTYQMEERVEQDAAGRPRASFAFFCSQKCLHQSHEQGESGLSTCDACATSFRVELASQVLFVDKQRQYACTPDCRQQILAEARGVRLGELSAQASVASDQADDLELPPVLQPGRSTPPPSPQSALRDEPSAPRGQVVEIKPGSQHAGAAQASAAPSGAPALSGVPRILAVFNHKGGTGKTTTSVTIAAGLAERGARVLLVDSDAQGNVGVSLGLTVERSLYHVLVMGLPLADAVQNVRPGLDVLPSNETLAAAELYLAGRRNRDRVLASRFEGVLDHYDYVVVDCSPSLSLMNQNALVLSDAVLCPVACDYLSLVGVRQVLRTIKHVNKLLNHPVQLWGVLPTLFDSRARICHEALDTLREHFRDRCLEPIRAAIKVKEAPAQGKTLLEYAPGSSAATDYIKVVDRLLAETAKFKAQPAAEQSTKTTTNSGAQSALSA